MNSPIFNTLHADHGLERLGPETSMGALLLDSGKLKPEDAERVLRMQKETGIRFGEDWLWHIFHPQESDWFPNSEKPAVALCVFKDYYPDLAIPFAGELQYALHFEGRDLCDDEAYRHLVEKYKLPEKDFFTKLHQPAYKEKAYDEFALVRQLNVTGFPAVFLQVAESKFYLLARGYTDYRTMKTRLEQVPGDPSGDTGDPALQ